MKRMSPEAKVGLLVLAGLLILVYMSLKVGRLELGRGGGYVVLLRLDDAVGLSKDGEVLMAGIPVGVVEEIRLDRGEAVLSLRMSGGVRLPVDSTASLRTKGVLGEKYVEIQLGAAGEELRDGDPITAGVPPGDLDRLVTQFNDIAQDVKQVTARLAVVLGTPEGEADLREIILGLREGAIGIRDIVAENRTSLRATLENAEVLSRDLREIVDSNRDNLSASLENTRRFSETLAQRTPGVMRGLEALSSDLGAVVAENREDLRQGLVNLREATARLGTTLEAAERLIGAIGSEQGTLGRMIHDDSLYRELRDTVAGMSRVLGRLERGEGTLGKLLTDEEAYAELKGSLENLNAVTDRINRGEGTIGKLVTDEKTHENLNETLEGITGFVGGANRFQFELSYTGEYLANREELKSYLGLEIRPRQDRFYSFAVVDPPDDEFDDGDDLKFSAQLGKRFSFLTLRGGMLESEGGFGLDTDFWADRLRLSFEAFDFGRQPGPAHLKLAARWRLLRNVFITAGWDDFIDDEGRDDIFVGAGIRFLDEDLKFLLAPAASLAR